ncbi:hypothetical protein A5769_20775 [Mycobacterium intracellulare]|nr:hypothetical protein A5769_20775 [Mycobacterium intracellulare]
MWDKSSEGRGIDNCAAAATLEGVDSQSSTEHRPAQVDHDHVFRPSQRCAGPPGRAGYQASVVVHEIDTAADVFHFCKGSCQRLWISDVAFDHVGLGTGFFHQADGLLALLTIEIDDRHCLGPCVRDRDG